MSEIPNDFSEERALHDRIVADALAASRALRVQVTRLDSAKRVVYMSSAADSSDGGVQRAIKSVVERFPGFDPSRVTLTPDVNEPNARVYLQGETVLTTLEEVAEGVVSRPVAWLARTVGRVRFAYVCPLKATGRVEGALTFLFDHKPDDRLQTVCQAFASQASFALENQLLYRSAEARRLFQDGLLAGMTDGVVAADQDGRVLFANERASELLRMEGEQLLGQHATEMLGRLTSFGDNTDVVGTVRAALEGSEVRPDPVVATLKEPPPRHVAIVPFRAASASPVDATGFLIRDVTSELEYERRRNVFFSVAAHDIRTPMSSVVGYSELLLAEETDAERRRWLEYVHGEAQRLTTVLDDFLDLSRISLGQLSISLDAVSVSAVVARVLDGVRPTASGHTFTVDAPQSLPRVLGETDRLIQVLRNVVDNAIKYSPDGGEIRIEARVDRANPKRAILSVSDEGIGIKSEAREALFALFQRANDSDGAQIRGLGIGLWVARELLFLMGGEIWVESRPGRGSTFFCALRLAESPTA